MSNHPMQMQNAPEGKVEGPVLSPAEANAIFNRRRNELGKVIVCQWPVFDSAPVGKPKLSR